MCSSDLLGREIRGRVVVVVSRPDSVLRELVRTLLRQITELDVSAYIDIQLSASIGWVPAKAADYDLNALIVDADAAACEATRRGGDCWERVRA